MNTALVLVHGGAHSSRCWAPTVDALAALVPDRCVLAIDLPGREGVPGDLTTITIADNVASAVAQIHAAGLDHVVLVGHSLAGVTLPGIATALGATRTRRMIMVACAVPPQGRRVVDTLAQPLRALAIRGARSGGSHRTMPWAMSRWLFCNGMTPEQTELVRNQLCDEAAGLVIETIDRSALPSLIPRTWVLPLRDRSLRPKLQRRFIENLGGVDDVVEIDAGHDVMVSHPEQLARILADRC